MLSNGFLSEEMDLFGMCFLEERIQGKYVIGLQNCECCEEGY